MDKKRFTAKDAFVDPNPLFKDFLIALEEAGFWSTSFEAYRGDVYLADFFLSESTISLENDDWGITKYTSIEDAIDHLEEYFSWINESDEEYTHDVLLAQQELTDFEGDLDNTSYDEGWE